MESHLNFLLQIAVLLVVEASTVKSSGQHHNGIDFVGVGYNLLKGNPDGGTGGQGGVDPGLNILRKVFALSPGDIPAEVLFEERYSCLDVKSTYVFYGAKSYQEKLGANVDASGKGNAGLLSFAFSLSPRFNHARSETNQNRRVFHDEEYICNLGRARFQEELATTHGFSVTTNFAAAVCKLPMVYDTKAYMDFLDDWGTHITIEVEMGNKTIKRSSASLTEFIKHVENSGGFGFQIGGSYLGYGASIGVDFSKFKQSDEYKLNFGQHQSTLISGREGQPEPIGLKVKTLVEALNPTYWQSPQVIAECPVARSQLSNKNNNILKALENYAQYKLAPKIDDPALRIPVTWPAGTYGLIKATSGCPAGRISWHEGSRYQDTENMFNKNAWSNPIHISGSFSHSHDMSMEFCMKGDERISEFDVNWPAGDYCILKYGNCPAAFQSGWIYWDDENIRNHDHSHGSLPDGHYDKNTRIDFCCRGDALPTKEILLPTEKPFFLLKYTRECQRVHGMAVREEFLRWDDQDFINRDKDGGAHPYDDGGKHNHRLHFCYYYKSGTHLIG